MKFAIGLMACIAIAFVFVTSPDSQPRASIDQANIAAQTQAIADLASSVAELQYSIGQQRDGLEKRMDQRFVALANALPPQSAAPTAMPDSDELWTAVRALEAKQAELDAKVKELETLKASLKAATVTTTSAAYPSAGGALQAVTSGGSSGGVSVTTTSQSYSPRWTNNDGKSLRDHMIQDHGFDPSLSTPQMAMQHDAYHDQYGPASPVGTQYRNVAAQLSAPSSGMTGRTVTRTRSNVTSSCPGGNCPVNGNSFGSSGMSRSVNVQSRGGLLGRGVFRFRR
ncbi:MAG: hypothetical protein IT422_04995 [Pirellulaceae bacterium]|nr:hypothetical protein [Pirellulaceae bacterium]